MKKRSNLDQVKAVAIALLMTDVGMTEYSPMVVQHPFTSSGLVAIRKAGEIQMIDITESDENFRLWQDSVTEMINSAKAPFDVYMMVNKPYALTFLKYASPYLTKPELSKILANAWMRSENPNMDPNVSQQKLISLFRMADPKSLMDEEELTRLAGLDDPVTIYRGVTSYNADHVRAMSWTLNIETAEWFSHRFNEDGAVYEAQIAKEHILALFNGRNESEVVVEPIHLMNVEQVSEPTNEIIMS